MHNSTDNSTRSTISSRPVCVSPAEHLLNHEQIQIFGKFHPHAVCRTCRKRVTVFPLHAFHCGWDVTLSRDSAFGRESVGHLLVQTSIRHVLRSSREGVDSASRVHANASRASCWRGRFDQSPRTAVFVRVFYLTCRLCSARLLFPRPPKVPERQRTHHPADRTLSGSHGPARSVSTSSFGGTMMFGMLSGMQGEHYCSFICHPTSDSTRSTSSIK